MVKIAFPLNVRSPQATYEIPYGTIQRPSIGEEHVAQKWVDISESEYGVSLLNDSRYGHDIKDNVIRLSVLRSPDKPVKATDEIGVHNIKYGLYPHSGNWQEANVTRRGYEFNYPLIALVDSVHNGDLPAVLSFIEIEPQNIVLTVLKRCEDSDDMMIRFYETNGENGMACIILSDYLSVDAVHKADLLENPLEDIQTNGKKFTVPVGKFAIESYKLIRDID
jgi:alpha-mannosidase